MIKRDSDLIPANCRQCGRTYGLISFREWKRDTRSLHGVVCTDCGHRADSRVAKASLPDPKPIPDKPTYSTQHRKEGHSSWSD